METLNEELNNKSDISPGYGIVNMAEIAIFRAGAKLSSAGNYVLA